MVVIQRESGLGWQAGRAERKVLIQSLLCRGVADTKELQDGAEAEGRAALDEDITTSSHYAARCCIVVLKILKRSRRQLLISPIGDSYVRYIYFGQTRVTNTCVLGFAIPGGGKVLALPSASMTEW